MVLPIRPTTYFVAFVLIEIVRQIRWAVRVRIDKFILQLIKVVHGLLVFRVDQVAVIGVQVVRLRRFGARRTVAFRDVLGDLQVALLFDIVLFVLLQTIAVPSSVVWVIVWVRFTIGAILALFV